MAQKILLVEPDAVLAKTVSKGLIKAGYKLYTCHTAQEAVSLADVHKFDLIICELLLVSHSGIEFLYEFRSYADWQQIPVLIFSIVPPKEFAGSRDGLMEELSVSGYLYKPNTTLPMLISSVRDILQPSLNEAA